MCKKLIQELLDKELFLPIDLYFAHAFVSLDSSLSILIAYIFAMARQGHLCIRLENNKIAPSPALLFLEQAGLLEELIKLNFFSLPLHICQKIEREEEVPFTPFCIFKGALYLQKNWILQQEFIKHIRRLQKREVHSLPGIIPINSALNIEQKMAVQRALSSPISVISGGPGTGKTFTAAHIVQAFYQGLSDERKKTVQIKLAAPTGKAAALLEKNLQERLSHLPGISSGTLHSFLKSSGGFAQTLYADLLLVDEASMLDATLFVRMLKNLKAGGLIVLIGDKDQLPPVEAGGFFADLIDRSEDWNIPVTLLQKGLRAENKILDERIRRGTSCKLFKRSPS
jgi:exodeoxyribonuclease V alpha subunit